MTDAFQHLPATAGPDTDTPFRHIVITRYNLRLPTAERAGFNPVDPGWLEQREALFLRYCTPSMASQTARDVRWVLLVHPETPERFLAPIERSGEVILTRGLRDALDRLSDLIPEDGRALITTRLDNDDALAPDFLEVSRNAALAHRAGDRSAVTLAHGLRVRLDTMQARRKFLRRGPFLTMIETSPPWRMAIRGNHERLHEEMPFETIRTDEPMWVQTIHGQNIMNSFESGEGAFVDLRYFVHRFPGIDRPWEPG